MQEKAWALFFLLFFYAIWLILYFRYLPCAPVFFYRLMEEI